MYCKKCGSEILDEAVICPHCGCATENNQTENADGKAKGGWIFLTILIPLVGIIMGIVNLSNGKKNSGKVYLTVGLIAWAVYFVLQMATGGM